MNAIILFTALSQHIHTTLLQLQHYHYSITLHNDHVMVIQPPDPHCIHYLVHLWSGTDPAFYCSDFRCCCPGRLLLEPEPPAFSWSSPLLEFAHPDSLAQLEQCLEQLMELLRSRHPIAPGPTRV